jgi:hypothetical protein
MLPWTFVDVLTAPSLTLQIDARTATLIAAESSAAPQSTFPCAGSRARN